MWRGLFTAATGMVTESRRTDVIANNLANAANTGYKKDTAVHREFENMLIKRMYDQDNNSGGVKFGGLLDTDSGDITKFKGFKVNQNDAPVIGELGLGDYIDEIAVDYSQGAFAFSQYKRRKVFVTRAMEHFSEIRTALFKIYAATTCLIHAATQLQFLLTLPIQVLRSLPTVQFTLTGS